MINVFRKIRKKLVTENKVFAYLRYALGEILLVVIGILIALQVNNWNEQRKTQEKIQEVKNALEAELNRNLNVVGRLIDIGYVLGEELEDIKQRDTLENLTYGEDTIYGEVFGVFDTFNRTLNIENLDDFIAYEKALEPNDRDLIALSKFLKYNIEKRELWQDKATSLSLARFKEFSDELPWLYDTDDKADFARQHYLKTDPLFKNKVIHYLNFQLNENIFYATVIRALTLSLHYRLQKTVGEADMKTHLSKNNLSPFIKADCGSELELQHEALGFRNAFLVYNISTELAVIKKFDKHRKVQRDFKIPPNFFAWVELSDGEYLQRGETCESLYMPVKHGFLLIED